MVASPDHLLDPRFGYEPEQHEEWLREEFEMPPKYALERDENHDELSNAARKLGAFVIDSDKFAQYHPGFPDSMWAIWWIGQTWLVEYKVGDAQLSDVQEAFRQQWVEHGGIHIKISSVEDVERLLRR